MSRQSIAGALLVLAHYALLAWMAHATTLLFGGVLKAIALAAFALLLLFVVRRSSSALKLVSTCCARIPSSLCASSLHTRWTQRTESRVLLPDEPLLSSLFQRPPPTSSR